MWLVAPFHRTIWDTVCNLGAERGKCLTADSQFPLVQSSSCRILTASTSRLHKYISYIAGTVLHTHTNTHTKTPNFQWLTPPKIIRFIFLAHVSQLAVLCFRLWMGWIQVCLTVCLSWTINFLVRVLSWWMAEIWGKSNHKSTFKASACIPFIHMPLAKASYVAKSVHRGKICLYFTKKQIKKKKPHHLPMGFGV